MQLDHLLYFTKIVECESFAKASNELFVTPQALSSAIKKLEEELGCVLFERTKHGVHLLEDGKYVYERAKHILEECDDLGTHFRVEQEQSLTGSLTVATNQSLKDYVLPEIISYFLRVHPDVQIRYIIAENDEILDMVSNKRVDIGLMPYLFIDKKTLQEFPENLRFVSLFKFDYDCIVSQKSSLAKCKSISMASIIKKKIIINSFANTDMNNNLIQQLVNYFSTDVTIIETDSDRLFFQLIKDNLGVGILPHHVRPAYAGIASIPITDNIKSFGGYLYNTQSEENPLLKPFIKKLQEFNRNNL